jgi:hypothetical protein
MVAQTHISTAMIKYFLLSIVVLSGCAMNPKPPAQVYVPAYQYMNSFRADCKYAPAQIEYLEKKLVEYQQYHEYYPYTDADTQYYRQVKNALWALRSSCVSK